MRISHQHKFLYLSNPRCGSTSLRVLLTPFSDIESNDLYFRAIFKRKTFQRIFSFQTKLSTKKKILRACIYYFKDRNGNPLEHHSRARTIKKYFEHLDWNWDEYFSFTTIRNPWDRVVSVYHYGKKNPDSVWNQWASKFTFDEFLLQPEVVKKLASYSITEFCYDENKTKIVDHIIKLEDLDSEIPPLLEKINIKVDSIPKTNSSARGDYQPFYTPETKQIVEQIFEKDIQFGGYIF